ncbi:MAG TPA: hypothetical protein ENI33_04290 [Thermoplasmatales archaeon]|nr:hypothetical protein [Thermoplasmatales archaeon]
MKLEILVAGILSISILLSAGCLNKESTGEAGIILSMKEFISIMNNYSRDINNATKYEYYNITPLNDGDTVVIKDEIHNLTYNSTYNYTEIFCISDLDNPFPVSGNLTKFFSDGDKIEVILHIIRDVFPFPSDPSWTVSIETIEEGWSLSGHFFTPVSSDAVKKG